MRRLKLMNFGNNCLKVFCISLLIAVIVYIANIGNIVDAPVGWIIGGILIAILELIIFAVGISIVYVTSVQLGIKTRVIGALCGWIPILHLIMLGRIILIVSEEYKVELKRIKLNDSRKDQKICETKYPILMVHGVFFRDFKYLNYWGRVPKDLEDNGATLFYGNHNSAASVDDSAKELARRIEEVLKATGASKVNIIAHSKGGLDSRTAISLCGMDKYVASLTTINTPHRGCEFAEYILDKMPEKQKEAVASAYNKAASELGDINPDFISAVTDLTRSRCQERNKVVKDSELVFYQSFGSKIDKPQSGKFPLNLSMRLVGLFDGPNDGLVGINSFKWGEEYTFVEPHGRRGISHGDVIDLNRENIKGYDVREFYVNLVQDLKRRGF